MHLDDKIDSQFYIIDSSSLDVSLEWNATLVVAWLRVYMLYWRDYIQGLQ